MKNFTTKVKMILLGLLVFSGFNASSQILFSENFQGAGSTFPTGWAIINVDGLTPDANVAYVTDAWISREDFVAGSAGDSMAVSTSWYSPAGQSDDWMITPQITGIAAGTNLTWESMAPDGNYPDGYEVWVSTGPPTVAGMTAGTMVYSTAADVQTWTQQSVSLAAFAGQSIYVAWRNNSNDMFLLFVDSIRVETPASNFDAAMTGSSEYTLVPMPQVTPLGASGTIDNVGPSAVTNAVMTVNVYDGTMTNVYTATSTPIASIPAAGSATATVPGYTPATPDLYTVEQIVSITETDADANNDTFTYQIAITDSTYGRDDAIVTGSLGIGAGTSGEIGQLFTMNTPDDLTSVDIFIANTGGTMTGQPLSANIYDVVNGLPATLLTTTNTITVDTSTNTLWNLDIMGGQFLVNVDSFAVIAVEGDSNVTVGTTAGIFTAMTTYVNFPGNPFGGWAYNEDYGFPVTYVIRANFGDTTSAGGCAGFAATGSGTDETTQGANDGTATATATGGTPPYTYSWTPGGGTTATITNLAPGTYTCIVADNNGCMDTVTVIVNPGGCDPTFAANVTGTDETTPGANDGTGMASPTNGTAPFTYDWQPGGMTTASVTGLAPGTYICTVTDANNCIAIDTLVVAPAPIGIFEQSAGMTLNAYPNPISNELNLILTQDNADNVQVNVTNILGDIVWEMDVNSVSNWNQTISTVSWAPGVYHVAVQNSNGTAVFQVVKE